MAAGGTYDVIATTTLGSTASSYTFSSIPGTYTDLVIVFSGNGSPTDFFSIRFNGDTTTAYSVVDFYGTGASAASFRANNVTKMSRLPVVNNSIAKINVMNYANTTTFKTVLSRGDSTSDSTHTVAGLWRSGSAITSVTLVHDAGSFSVGSTFTLYGITAA